MDDGEDARCRMNSTELEDGSPEGGKDYTPMLQELKKENFDLKLRLYTIQMQNQESVTLAENYEEELATILEKLEEQEKLTRQKCLVRVVYPS